MSKPSKKICITNRHLVAGDFLTQIVKILKPSSMRPDTLILREKDLAPADYQTLATSVKAICEDAGVAFIAHTYIKEAIQIGAAAIHLPMAAFLAMDDAEKQAFETIGVSAHRLDDVLTAQEKGAAYATFSPIFPTQCKPGAAGTGTATLKTVCDAAAIPIVALGGIHPDNIESCLDAGAAGVCMMSEYMQM